MEICYYSNVKIQHIILVIMPVPLFIVVCIVGVIIVGIIADTIHTTWKYFIKKFKSTS